MHAAGKPLGKWLSWSRISETKGLITIESPPNIIEDIIYVKDFPEAVSEMKRVDFLLRILIIVSYCPYLKF